MGTTREDLRRNIEAFKEMEDRLLGEDGGKYALLYGGELVGTFLDKESAHIEAARMHPDGGFAISPAIGSRPASLGAVGLYASPVAV